MSKTYMKRTCFICNRQISGSGLAQTSHMRMHVKKGEAVEQIFRDDRGTYSRFAKAKVSGGR